MAAAAAGAALKPVDKMRPDIVSNCVIAGVLVPPRAKICPPLPAGAVLSRSFSVSFCLFSSPSLPVVSLRHSPCLSLSLSLSCSHSRDTCTFVQMPGRTEGTATRLLCMCPCVHTCRCPSLLSRQWWVETLGFGLYSVPSPSFDWVRRH